MRSAVKGDEVVLAEAVQTDVLDNHHFVVLLGEDRPVQDVIYVFFVTLDTF